MTLDISDIETDEQQAERLTQWWKRSLKFIVLLLIIVIGFVFVINAWRDSARSSRELASGAFSELMDAVGATVNVQGQEAEQKTTQVTLKTLAEKIVKQDNGGAYPHLARLQLIKVAMDQDDVKAAEAELKALLADKPDEVITAVAVDRLARLMADQARYEEAFVLLGSLDSKLSSARFAELKGDIRLAEGKRAEAYALYQTARLGLGDAFEKNVLLKMKMDDLADVNQK